jgi:hypothetical protein
MTTMPASISSPFSRMPAGSASKPERSSVARACLTPRSLSASHEVQASESVILG